MTKRMTEQEKLARKIGRGLIKFFEKNNWTQGAQAKNSKRQPVDPIAEDAVCFCAVGGLRAMGCDDPSLKMFVNYFRAKSGVGLVTFNDTEAKSKEDLIEKLTEVVS